MTSASAAHPDVRPPDERTALTQRLDQYRSFVRASLADVTWDQASARLLTASDLTIAGIVKHLAWAEDRWFVGRLLGHPMPPPWDRPRSDDPHAAMHLDPTDTIAGIIELYDAACTRARAALTTCTTLDAVAALPSFDREPVNARWLLVHMIDETARHTGHLDLLLDCLRHPHGQPPSR